MVTAFVNEKTLSCVGH